MSAVGSTAAGHGLEACHSLRSVLATSHARGPERASPGSTRHSIRRNARDRASVRMEDMHLREGKIAAQSSRLGQMFLQND